MHSELMAAKPFHDKFVEVTNKKIEKCLTEDEKVLLEKELEEASKSWRDIAKESEVRQKNIEKLMKPVRKFHEKEKTFVAILKQFEKRSQDLTSKPDDGRKAQDILKDTKVGSSCSYIFILLTLEPNWDFGIITIACMMTVIL